MNVEELTRLKNLKNYSNAKISQLSGIPEVTLQKIFSGTTKNPRQGTLLAIERALKIEDVCYEYEALDAEGSELLLSLKEEELAYRVTRKRNGEYTVEDYAALPEEQRVELIEGSYFQMEAPSIVHQDIAFSVHRQIHDFVRSHGGKCRSFEAPVDVELGDEENTVVQPDVLIVCDPTKITSKRIVGAPDFVLEILSSGSRKKDLMIKPALYEKWGICEYWILDPVKELLIRYDFGEHDYVPKIQPICGTQGLSIYQGECKINLEEIRELLREHENYNS